MPETLRADILTALRDMHFDVSAVTDDTPLGEGGLDLESLSLAELTMQLGDRGARFEDDELDTVLAMSFGALVAESDRRAGVRAGAPTD